MNQYKAICLDIDGTLLNSKHEITKITKRTIQIAAYEKHLTIILVSARMPKGIEFLQKELNITHPIICYNGALICNNKKKLLNITMPASVVREVYNICKKLGLHISLYKDDEWYIEEMDDWAIQESKITRISPKMSNFTSLVNEWEQINSGPNKILCMADPNNIELLHTRLKEYSFGDLTIYPSKTTYLEMMHNSATKTSAIEFLCNMLNIEKSEIIAIGDNFNDISMIEYAGLGIAMENAPKQVKKYANDITLSNDNDGVAEAIKKHILS